MDFLKRVFKKNSYFFLGLILTLTLLWPLVYAPYFTHHDDVQVIRLFEMNKCIQDGQIPCRWVPDLGGLYGYPIFNYYGPLPYYVGEIFYGITNKLIDSAKAMFAIAFVGSYIFMFLCSRKIWGEKGALISSVFYSFAPYHSVDFYVRGAMGELWAIMFFPAIVWSVFRLREKPNLGNSLLLGFFFALLIVSHNLSAMIFSPFLICLIFLLYILEREKRILIFAFTGLFSGVALAAFYWIPAFFEKSLVHLETTIEGYFSYTEHFKGLRKLFLDYSWGYGSSIREVPGGPKDGLSYQIGPVHLLGWILSLIAAKLLWVRSKEKSLLIIFLSLSILVCVFMIHPRSEFVWRMIQPLWYLQFPWRFLELIIFFVSLLAGSFTSINVRKVHANIILAALIILVSIFNFQFFKPQKFIYENDKQVLSGDSWDRQIKRSIFDYLPIYAEQPPAELATFRYKTLTGLTNVSEFKEGSDWFEFKAKTTTHTIIRMSQYYFPNWTILVDGKQIIIDYENSLGLMTFILGVGDHIVQGKLQNTTLRSVANLVTLLSIIVFIVLSLIQIKKIRKFLIYYLKVLKI